MSPPGKLLYLDCEEVNDSHFLLSWCWPACGDETGPLCKTTLAVVEYREGQQWTRLTDDITKSPYIAECKLMALVHIHERVYLNLQKDFPLISDIYNSYA